MEAWKAILIAFGGNAALIAVLAYLAKLLVSEWIKRASEERRIIFSKLHEKRAEALADLYVGLYEYVSNCKSFVLQAEHVEEYRIDELLTELSAASKAFRDTFQKNKLYLNKNLCNQIENTFKDAQMPSYRFIFSLGEFVGEHIQESEFRKEWENAFLSFSKHIPELLGNLENEFRAILGADNFS